jgi:antirestriction protein ArdC
MQGEEGGLRKMTSDVYSLVNDRILYALSQGIIPWKRPWTGSLSTNYDSGKEYRGINILSLGIAEMVQGYSSPYWLTFLQAQKHGGHIKKGEKATYIVFSDKKVREIQKEDGTTEQKVFRFVRSFPVFNWEQTECVPKKESGATLEPDRNLLEVCNNVLAKMPNPPAYRESGSSAYYAPREDRVNLPPIGTFKTTEGYAATKFHEYGHSTGHESRLNRSGIMGVASFGGEEYSFEELVAELTSAYLCARNGINNTLENSSAYIQNWMKALRDDKTLLMKASGKAMAAVDYIRAKEA